MDTSAACGLLFDMEMKLEKTTRSSSETGEHRSLKWTPFLGIAWSLHLLGTLEETLDNFLKYELASLSVESECYDDRPGYLNASWELERKPFDEEYKNTNPVFDHIVSYIGQAMTIDNSPLRILIVGAGIGGLTAALALRRQSHQVHRLLLCSRWC